MMNYTEVKPLKNSEVDLFVEDCNLFAVFDAPVNVLFARNFINNIESYKGIFFANNMHENIFFSCKSNKSKCFLKLAAEHDCGIEVSSVYELEDALKFTKKIIASGPAKNKEYLTLSINNGIMISIDDIEELKTIVNLNYNKKIKIFLRINDILDNSISRFGINLNQLNECLEIITNSKNLLLEGFSFHINNYNLDDRINAIDKILVIIKKLQLSIKFIDIGGGLPNNYCTKENYYNFLKNNNPTLYFKNKNINDYYPYYNEQANENALNYILSSVKDRLGSIQIIIEPGRSLLNNCGISIYNIEYLKKISNGDNLIVTNGNINCLSEQWFNSDYLIEPLLYKRNKELYKLDKPFFASVAGNLCLEQDMITWRKIKFDYMPEKNDYLIYYNTAGYQMDSNESEFHKIPLVKKVVVDKFEDKFIIREDESYDS